LALRILSGGIAAFAEMPPEWGGASGTIDRTRRTGRTYQIFTR
jgi:hypothetical protein